MIWAAKYVSSRYITPTQQAIAGYLLDYKYEIHMKKVYKNLYVIGLTM